MNLTSLDSLKIFCDVVRQKSFSRAASMNEVSQSAASQAVSQIEKHLGVRLIDRSKRPFTLTAEGQIYYEECRDLVDRYLSVEARIRARHNKTICRVNVAAIYSVVLYHMNQYVERFLKDYPRGHVRFQYLHPDDVYDSVLSEQADLGLLSFPKPRRELQVIPWRNEPMALVCSPTHRFARTRKVSVAKLHGEDFVAFESGLAIRRNIDGFLRRHKVEVNVVMAFDNIEFIKRGIETSAGVAILPEPTVSSEVRKGSLKVVRMRELELVRPLCIIHRRKRVLTPAMLDFVEVLLEDDDNGAGNVQSRRSKTIS